MNQIVSENQGLRALASNVEIGATGIRAHSLAEVMDFGQLMAKAGPMVGKPFREKPGACVAIAMQAFRLGADPFAMSQKAFVVGETIGYEAQLIAAIINMHAPLKTRPKYKFEGDGAKRRCIVTATMRGEKEPCVYESPEIGKITPKNSPLWKTDEDQQLGYYSIRGWGRRYTPEIILGMYTAEELADANGAAQEARVIDLSGAAATVSAPKAPAAPIETAEFTEAIPNAGDSLPEPVVTRSPIEDEIANSLLDAANENDVDTIWGFFADAIQTFDADQQKRIDLIFAETRARFAPPQEDPEQNTAPSAVSPAVESSPLPAGATDAEQKAPAAAVVQKAPQLNLGGGGTLFDEGAFQKEWSAFEAKIERAGSRAKLAELQTEIMKSAAWANATAEEQEEMKQRIMRKLRSF